MAFDSGVGNNETISPRLLSRGGMKRGVGGRVGGQGVGRGQGGETDGRGGRKSTAPDNGRQRLTTVPN